MILEIELLEDNMSMKKILLPLLASFLLTGCYAKVASPKFAAKGEKVSVTKFYKALNEMWDKSSFNSVSRFKSFEFTVKSSENEQKEKTHAKKRFSVESSSVTERMTNKYDSKELVYTAKGKKLYHSTEKSETKNTKNNYVVRTDEAIQVSSVKNQLRILVIDNSEKSFSSYMELDKKSKAAPLFDSRAKEYSTYFYDEFFSIENDYNDASEKDKKNYTFYVNGKIFTVEYNATEEEKFALVSKTIYKGETTTKKTIQLDATEGKWVKKIYEVKNYKAEYETGYENYAKGDSYVEDKSSSSEISLTTKDVKLSEVDVTDYTGYGI